MLQTAEGVWDVYRETVSTRWDPDEGRWTMWYLGYAVSFFDDPGIGQAHRSWSTPYRLTPARSMSA